MDSSIVRIDGSVGEGGGQILRTAMMLSTLTGRGIVMDNIRTKRPNPGLRPQHLAALKVFAIVTSGQLAGAEVGSTAVRFIPGDSKSGEVTVDVGTAGSITLILSALVPALSLTGRDMTIRIRGGTDTKWSPTLDYFHEVAGPLFRSFGVNFSLHEIRRGYYPAGGGEVLIEVHHGSTVNPLNCVRRGSVNVMVKSVCSNLPKHVAERQARSAERLLEGHGIKVTKSSAVEEPAISPGSAICVYAEGVDRPVGIGGDAVGERGVKAEEVGEKSAHHFLSCYESGAALDVHCADMAVPLMCLARGESEIGFTEMTGHIESNIYVTELFFGKRFVREKDGGIEVLRTITSSL